MPLCLWRHESNWGSVSVSQCACIAMTISFSCLENDLSIPLQTSMLPVSTLALCCRLLPHVQSLPSLCIECLWPTARGYITFSHPEAAKTRP